MNNWRKILSWQKHPPSEELFNSLISDFNLTNGSILEDKQTTDRYRIKEIDYKNHRIRLEDVHELGSMLDKSFYVDADDFLNKFFPFFRLSWQKQKPFRVWWWRAGEGTEYYSVETIPEAIGLLNKLAADDLSFDSTVSANAGGLEEYNDYVKDWEEYYDDEGRDIWEIIEESNE